MEYKIALLDFTKSTNLLVRDQGKVYCIKTKSKGWFCPALERYPSRQDLAEITILGTMDMQAYINDDAFDFTTQEMLDKEKKVKIKTLEYEFNETNLPLYCNCKYCIADTDPALCVTLPACSFNRRIDKKSGYWQLVKGD